MRRTAKARRGKRQFSRMRSGVADEIANALDTQTGCHNQNSRRGNRKHDRREVFVEVKILVELKSLVEHVGRRPDIQRVSVIRTARRLRCREARTRTGPIFNNDWLPKY